jgi:ATP synthase subunit 6
MITYLLKSQVDIDTLLILFEFLSIFAYIFEQVTMINSPLEQFYVTPILPLIGLYCPYDRVYAFTNSALILFFIISVFVFISSFILRYIPGRYQMVLENTYLFIKNLLGSNAGFVNLKYFPLLYTIFTLILLSNLFGMVPYSFTVTSHLIFTFSLALLSFFGITYIGFARHGVEFFGLFFPSGAPVILAPLLVFIELVSYIARVFSLSIRLFANLMSGHTLLKILSEFAWYMVIGLGIGSVLSLFPVIVIFLITGLEVAIAMLQAYVFTILLCIYLNDAVNLH